MCVSDVQGDPKTVLDTLELESQVVVGPLVDARNQTRVL